MKNPLRLIPWLAISASVGVGASGAGSPLAIEQAASEWVKIRAESVRLQTEWDTERGLLASTVEMMKDRAERLATENENTRAKSAEERGELDTLTTKREEADASLSKTQEELTAVSARLLALREKLPPRLSAALEFSLRSLEGNDPSVGDRMQLVMTVLNRCAQFNAAVMCGEEVLELGDEGRAVDVIYWGLSHGYAVDRHSNRAWFGTAATGKWAWTEMPEAVEPATKLIAIYRDQQDPELVAVPARLAVLVQP